MTYKKGQKAFLHKEGCQCFRCTKIPHNKNKSYEELYGKERTIIIKQKMVETRMRKGSYKANKGSFPKGNIPKCPFKKGHIGWTKGKGIRKGKYKTKMINGKEYKLHRIIWVQHNQIPIPKRFVIHHIDGNVENNHIKNLILLPNDYHSQLHKFIIKRQCET